MVDPIHGLGGVGGLGGAEGTRPQAPIPDGITPFKELLENSIQRVNEMQKAAEQASVAGNAQNFSDVMTSVRKAEIAFEQLPEIRNKLVDAYQEVMRMQI